MPPVFKRRPRRAQTESTAFIDILGALGGLNRLPFRLLDNPKDLPPKVVSFKHQPLGLENRAAAFFIFPVRNRLPDDSHGPVRVV